MFLFCSSLFPHVIEVTGPIVLFLLELSCTNILHQNPLVGPRKHLLWMPKDNFLNIFTIPVMTLLGSIFDFIIHKVFLMFHMVKERFHLSLQ